MDESSLNFFCLRWELALHSVICGSIPLFLFNYKLKTLSNGDNYSVSFIISLSSLNSWSSCSCVASPLLIRNILKSLLCALAVTVLSILPSLDIFLFFTVLFKIYVLILVQYTIWSSTCTIYRDLTVYFDL